MVSDFQETKWSSSPPQVRKLDSFHFIWTQPASKNGWGLLLLQEQLKRQLIIANGSVITNPSSFLMLPGCVGRI